MKYKNYILLLMSLIFALSCTMPNNPRKNSGDSSTEETNEIQFGFTTGTSADEDAFVFNSSDYGTYVQREIVFAEGHSPEDIIEDLKSVTYGGSFYIVKDTETKTTDFAVDPKIPINGKTTLGYSIKNTDLTKLLSENSNNIKVKCDLKIYTTKNDDTKETIEKTFYISITSK